MGKIIGSGDIFGFMNTPDPETELLNKTVDEILEER